MTERAKIVAMLKMLAEMGPPAELVENLNEKDPIELAKATLKVAADYIENGRHWELPD